MSHERVEIQDLWGDLPASKDGLKHPSFLLFEKQARLLEVKIKEQELRENRPHSKLKADTFVLNSPTDGKYPYSYYATMYLGSPLIGEVSMPVAQLYFNAEEYPVFLMPSCVTCSNFNAFEKALRNLLNSMRFKKQIGGILVIASGEAERLHQDALMFNKAK